MAILFIVMTNRSLEYCFIFVLGETERNMVVTFGGIFSLKSVSTKKDFGFGLYVLL